MNRCSRREFVKGAGAATAAWCALPILSAAESLQGPFRVRRWYQRRDFAGLRPCLLRRLTRFRPEVDRTPLHVGQEHDGLDGRRSPKRKRFSAKYDLRVTDIASPLFKTDWPGAPRSPYGSKGDMHGAVEVTFKHQDEVAGKSDRAARQFNTTSPLFRFLAARRCGALCAGYRRQTRVSGADCRQAGHIAGSGKRIRL